MLSLAFVTLWSYMQNKVAPLVQLKVTLNFEVIFLLNEAFQTGVIEQLNFSPVQSFWGVPACL